MYGMYGLYPAKFVKRHPRDTIRYEQVEVQWLLATWPSYMAAIEPEDPGEYEGHPPVYELTRLGVPTGELLLGDSYLYEWRTTEDILADDLVAEITKEINNDILRAMRDSMITPKGQRITKTDIGDTLDKILNAPIANTHMETVVRQMAASRNDRRINAEWTLEVPKLSQK